VGRNTLMLAGGRQSVRFADERIPASQFLLDLMARPEVARDYPVVRVDHPDILSLLGRGPTEVGRLSLAELEPHWPRIAEQAAQASQVPPKRRDPFQRAVLALFDKVDRLLALSQMEQPYAVPPLAPGEQWQPFHEAFLASQAPEG